MKMNTASIVAIIATVNVGIASAALAQQATTALPPEILACANESDVMLRLSCYDKEVAAYRNRPVASPTVAPSAPAASQKAGEHAVAAAVPATTVAAAAPAPAPVSTTETRSANSADNFGFDAPVDEISSAVARIRERPYGELIIYLDNGQVWEQKHLDRRFKLKTGESVTISKSAVAGYRLSGKSNRSIQVERLK